MAGNLCLKLIEYHEKIERIEGFYTPDDDATDDYFSYLKDSIERDDCLVLVADTGSKLVGFLRVEIEDRPPVYELKKEGNITDLFVKEEWRRKDIGSRLVKEVEGWLKEKGVNLLKTSVYVGNKSAQKFWDSRGFKNYISVKYKEK